MTVAVILHVRLDPVSRASNSRAFSPQILLIVACASAATHRRQGPGDGGFQEACASASLRCSCAAAACTKRPAGTGRRAVPSTTSTSHALSQTTPSGELFFTIVRTRRHRPGDIILSPGYPDGSKGGIFCVSRDNDVIGTRSWCPRRRVTTPGTGSLVPARTQTTSIFYINYFNITRRGVGWCCMQRCARSSCGLA